MCGWQRFLLCCLLGALGGCAYTLPVRPILSPQWTATVHYRAHALDSQASARTLAYLQAWRQLAQEAARTARAPSSAQPSALLAAAVLPVVVHEQWDGTTYRLTARAPTDAAGLAAAWQRLARYPYAAEALHGAQQRLEGLLRQLAALRQTAGEDAHLRQRYAAHAEALAATVQYVRGLVHAAAAQPQQALAAFDAALALDAHYAAAYVARGTVADELGDYRRALKDFDTAIALAPDFALAYASRGVTYARLAQHQAALADFDRAIALAPQAARVYYNRGTLYAEMGKDRQALADFDRAIALAPRDAAAYTNRGAVYARLGKDRQALADFNRAIALAPTHPGAYYNRGTLYAKRGKYRQAIADLQAALQLGLRQAERKLLALRQRQLVLEVQERLQRAGFNPGARDGLLGPQTRAALRRYQQRRGLPVTGEPDPATLQALGLAAAQ
ncbi:MAG: hypothetical protein KatS3mg131_3132 [Candidatus Tectimicrobiota bacterium]|nr:MAG: hypothetical protein KatS3mg131_3132 [Candidatus Tectomicrobia bacterium]